MSIPVREIQKKLQSLKWSINVNPDQKESDSNFAASLIGLHFAFSRDEPAKIEDVDWSQLYNIDSRIGVRISNVNPEARGIPRDIEGFLLSNAHAAVKDKNLIDGLRFNNDSGLDASPGSVAMGVYLAMHNRDSQSDRGQAARVWWNKFLKDNGIATQVPSWRFNIDPYVFHDQWASIVADSNTFRLLGAELQNFDSTTPKLFNVKEQTAPDFLTFFAKTDEEKTAAAKKKITQIALEKKQKQENNFKEQLMLMANVENLVSKNREHQYRNFSFLRGANPDVSLENQVYAFAGKDEFLNMTNLQISALVPYFKMFIIYGKGPDQKQFEVPLQGTFIDNEKELLQSRSRAIGFQNFSWTYEGKYLETAKKLIDSSLRLYGSTLATFNKVIGRYEPSAETQNKYSNQIKNTLDATGVASAAVSATRDKVLPPRDIRFADLLTRDRDLAFKVQCGWAVPHGVPPDLISERLKSFIDNNIITLIMELVEHTFEFEQDGTFGLNLRYKSRVENAMNYIDLLKSKEEKKNFSLENRKFEKELNRKFSKELAFNPTSKEDDNAPIFNSDVITEQEITNFADRHFPNQKERAIREIKSFLKAGDIKNHRQKAAQIVTRMIANGNSRRTGENLSRILSQVEDRGRMFYLEVDKAGFTNYFDRAKKQAEMQKEINSIPGELSDIERKKLRDEIVERYSNTVAAEKAQAAQGKVIKSVSISQQGNFELKTSEQLNNNQNRQNSFKLPFVYFGDLIESAIDVAGDEYRAEDLTMVLGVMPFKDVLVVPVDLPIIDFKNTIIKDRLLQIPLADVPISVKNYNAWIHNEYIKKPATRIELGGFIIGAFNNLIKPAFSGESDLLKLTAAQKTNLAVNSNTFTTDKKLNLGQISVDDLNGLAIANVPRAKKAMQNYVLYTSSIKTPPQKKPTLEDRKQGRIIDLQLGRDRGIIKKANFSKVSMANLVAARFMQDSGKNEKLDKVKEPYDVDLDMIGNNIFSNGVDFYLSPTVPGKDGQAVAMELGLGGYYVTTEASMNIDMMSGFTTTLRGKLQNFGPKPKEIAAAKTVASSKPAIKKAGGK